MREYTVHNRLNLHSVEGRERQDLENKLRDIEKELSFISEKKNQLKTDFKDIYDDDLLWSMYIRIFMHILSNDQVR